MCKKCSNKIFCGDSSGNHFGLMHGQRCKLASNISGGWKVPTLVECVNWRVIEYTSHKNAKTKSLMPNDWPRCRYLQWELQQLLHCIDCWAITTVRCEGQCLLCKVILISSFQAWLTSPSSESYFKLSGLVNKPFIRILFQAFRPGYQALHQNLISSFQAWLTSPSSGNQYQKMHTGNTESLYVCR